MYSLEQLYPLFLSSKEFWQLVKHFLTKSHHMTAFIKLPVGSHPFRLKTESVYTHLFPALWIRIAQFNTSWENMVQWIEQQKGSLKCRHLFLVGFYFYLFILQTCHIFERILLYFCLNSLLQPLNFLCGICHLSSRRWCWCTRCDL